MGSSYFPAESEIPFSELPVLDLREEDPAGGYISLPGSSFGKEILTACLPHSEMDALMLLPSCKVICLAGGPEKTESILAAARLHYFDTLVTDSNTALAFYEKCRD